MYCIYNTESYIAGHEKHTTKPLVCITGWDNSVLTACVINSPYHHSNGSKIINVKFKKKQPYIPYQPISTNSGIKLLITVCPSVIIKKRWIFVKNMVKK